MPVGECLIHNRDLRSRLTPLCVGEVAASHDPQSDGFEQSATRVAADRDTSFVRTIGWIPDDHRRGSGALAKRPDRSVTRDACRLNSR